MLPPVLFAQIVYVVFAHNSVGVPAITPVEELRFTPCGRIGEISQDVICPGPVREGFIVVIAVLIVAFCPFGI